MNGEQVEPVEAKRSPVPKIDLHAHILPALDHGCRSWDEAEGMARLACADGIIKLAATPHVNFESRPGAELIRRTTDEFRERLARARIDLEVLPGGDYLVTPELVSPGSEILTLGDNGRYFLLEFPPLVVPPGVGGIMKRFLDRGLTPVITHPERNRHFVRRPEFLAELAELGCLVQLTAGSFTGLFKDVVREAALDILEKDLCHLVASDAHWESERPPVISPAYRVISEAIGESAAEALVYDNPGRVLRGLDIT